MVHPRSTRVLYNRRSSQQRRLRRAEDVIDPPVIDRGPACLSTKIPEVLQYVAVRFRIILCIIGEQVGSLLGVQLEIEISGDEYNVAFRPSLSPLYDVPGEYPAARRIKSIGMGAYQHDVMFRGLVTAYLERRGQRVPVACLDVLEPRVPVLDQNGIYPVRGAQLADGSPISAAQ